MFVPILRVYYGLEVVVSRKQISVPTLWQRVNQGMYESTAEQKFEAVLDPICEVASWFILENDLNHIHGSTTCVIILGVILGLTQEPKCGVYLGVRHQWLQKSEVMTMSSVCWYQHCRQYQTLVSTLRLLLLLEEDIVALVKQLLSFKRIRFLLHDQ